MTKQLPIHVLRAKSLAWKVPIDSPEFARRMDNEDRFASFRQLFAYPKKKDLPNVDMKQLQDIDEECLYLCGQSLGLKPKSLDQYVKEVLNNWSQRAVHSHFNGYLPAALSDLPPKAPMAQIVGAKAHEVTIMNALTVNLHLLLSTFYRPSQRRHKIIIEEHAFSSDMFAVKSHLRLHGYSPEQSLVTLKPRPGEHLLREEDIVDVFEREGDQVMVAMLPAVQYYTGQLLNVERLTKAAQDRGIVVGVDLAHAVGNVPVYLHEWNVDFAAWCTYKYLCSGAGGIGGIFVHEKYVSKGGQDTFPMLQGWWGNNMKTKFMMKEDFDPCHGADMFKLSNPSPVLNAMLMASLDIYSQTTIEDLRQKQFLLTGYLEYMIKHHFPKKNDNFNLAFNRNMSMPSVEIITPADPEQRGAQLSLIFDVPLTAIQEELQKKGVVCDIRMPSVMRVAPVPIYNSFTDVYKFIKILYQIFQDFDTERKFFDNRANQMINEFSLDDIGSIESTPSSSVCSSPSLMGHSSDSSDTESLNESNNF